MKRYRFIAGLLLSVGGLAIIICGIGEAADGRSRLESTHCTREFGLDAWLGNLFIGTDRHIAGNVFAKSGSLERDWTKRS